MRPSGRRLLSRRSAALVLFGLFVVWAAFGWAVELYRSYWHGSNDPWRADKPTTWRVHSRHVARIESFLEEVRPRLRAGSSVVILSNPGPQWERFVRYLWFSYLLPRHDVRFGRRHDPAPQGDYWITYDTRLSRPELERVWGSEDGTLWRTVP